MDTLEKGINDIKTLNINKLATPETLELIAHRVYQNSTLSDEALDDDNDGAYGGFCQLLSSDGLKQYIADSIDNGVYGNFSNGQQLCNSASSDLMLNALQCYKNADKHPTVLWYLTDNDWPDSARLAKPEDVIRCFETIRHDAHCYQY